ncbi:MAG: hypothetical protein KJO66_01450 [Gammaproteobacteria bacterium]|nr:hypothetical protein [Gammaproteobacteria bacterium]
MTGATYAADNPPSSAQDLQYGEVLFHYYQDDWFNSIVRTHIAQTQERLPNHADEAELLLGGLDLNYGLRNEADNIFQRLLTEETTDEQTRNRAWYYLAKISYQRGDAARALRSIGQVQGDMSKGTRMESAHLASLVLLQIGANEQAIEILEDAKQHRVWSPYLAYNLGVAQIRSARQADGFEYLDHIGDISASSEEYRLLRDKANLALGYSLLRDGQAESSRDALNRVRLEGPLSSKALLGAGWADAEDELFGRALVPWLELSKRDTTDPAVQEALLAVPYAMTKMNLQGRAVKHYNDAIGTLYSEQDYLDESIAAIRRGALLEVLQAQDLRSGTGWLQELSFDTDNPVLRYQVTLMASHDFQEAVKNYRDLLTLRSNLNRWAQAIEAYDDMLDGREQRFAQHKPAARAALQAGDRAALQERLQRLGKRLEQIETQGNPVWLANAEETQQWQRLQDIKSAIAALPRNAQTGLLHERRTRLEGVLYWRLNSEYKPRLWEAKKQLAEVSDLLGQTRDNLESLESADTATPASFTGFDSRIIRNKARIEELLARTESTHLDQGRLIEQIAVRELEQQKERLDTYIVQARFSLAQTYDSAQIAGKGTTP